jgi:hypothetical protein
MMGKLMSIHLLLWFWHLQQEMLDWANVPGILESFMAQNQCNVLAMYCLGK